jgi:transposase
VNEGAPIANTHVPPQALNNVLRNDIGCTPQTLHNWVAQAERDRGLRGGVTTDERAQMNAMEREIKELREANEILRKASTYFAQAEFDRRPNSCRHIDAIRDNPPGRGDGPARKARETLRQVARSIIRRMPRDRRCDVIKRKPCIARPHQRLNNRRRTRADPWAY